MITSFVAKILISLRGYSYYLRTIISLSNMLDSILWNGSREHRSTVRVKSLVEGTVTWDVLPIQEHCRLSDHRVFSRKLTGGPLTTEKRKASSYCRGTPAPSGSLWSS